MGGGGACVCLVCVSVCVRVQDPLPAFDGAKPVPSHARAGAPRTLCTEERTVAEYCVECMLFRGHLIMRVRSTSVSCALIDILVLQSKTCRLRGKGAKEHEQKGNGQSNW